MSYRQRSETVSGYLAKLPPIDWDSLTFEETQVKLAEIRGQARQFYNMPIRSDDHIYEALEKKRRREGLFEELWAFERAARFMAMYSRGFDKLIIDEVHHIKTSPSPHEPMYDYVYDEEALERDRLMKRPSMKFKFEAAEIKGYRGKR